MEHGSAHIYLDLGRTMDIETVDKQLDKIVREAKYEEFKGKVINAIKSIFQKNPKTGTVAGK